MIDEIGHFALVLALCVAVIQATVPLYGAARGDGALIALARPAALAQFAFIATAFFALMHAYATSDFSLLNVAANSSAEKPMLYKITGVWSNNEGSMVLWVFYAGPSSAAAVAAFGGNLPPVVAGAGAVGAGDDLRRLSALHPLHLEPIPAALPRADRRQRPQPDPRGSRPRVPPANALRRLCRVLDHVLLRHRGADRGPRRPRPGRAGFGRGP